MMLQRKVHVVFESTLKPWANLFPGPIFGSIGFHHAMLRFCLADNVHLGTFQRTNGSAMPLGLVCTCLVSDLFFGIWSWSLEFGWPRLALHKAGFWCDSQINFKSALKHAFHHFRAWKRHQKISCSQPMFTVGLATWQASSVGLAPLTFKVHGDQPRFSTKVASRG